MRLMVVDDNRQIREGIHYGIAWSEYGIDEVREYADGEEAREALNTYQPDIIIADIKMPGMDGLQLLEHVRELRKNCRYILLSAYSDFTYAQKAIRLGADDYILKPIKPGKLVEIVMKNARDLLEAQKENKAYYDVYEKSFLHSMVNGGEIENVEKFSQMLEHKYQLKLPSNYAFLALLWMEQADGSMRKRPLKDQAAEQIKERLAEQGIVFNLQEDLLLFFGKGDRSQLLNLDYQYRVKNIIEGLGREWKEQNLAITTGISDARGLNELHIAYAHAKEALEQTYYSLSGACVIYTHTEKKEKEFPEEQQRDYMERIAKSVQKCDVEELHANIGSLLKMGLREKYDKVRMTGFIKKLYLYLIRHAGLESDPDFERRTLENAAHYENNIRDFEDYLIQGLQRGRELTQSQLYSVMIKNICTYMDEHYSEPISVDSVADVFGRTPNYVSSKFKKEVGKSFTDFLIELRVGKALNMLKYTDLPISEVAKKTGFSSYAYFSRTFRKSTGRNAGSFRSGGDIQARVQKNDILV
ncbi:response regulator [uncultured Robinsoniella sp.]|uniref:response regulator transcription factor n=2 Tax=Robinsoniella TaxID=588605 RepID=UPI00374F713A